jgi:hypothetical protein
MLLIANHLNSSIMRAMKTGRKSAFAVSFVFALTGCLLGFFIVSARHSSFARSGLRSIGTLLPVPWHRILDRDTVFYGGRQFYVDAEKTWSFDSADNNTLRFELRKGDQFSDNSWTDSPGVERTEIGDSTRIPISNNIHLEYKFMIEPGPTNTAQWLVMGQLHAGNGASPPFEVSLWGNDKMMVNANYGANAANTIYRTLYQDSQPLVRGHWYNMVVDVKFDNSGGGHLDVWRDGVQIVNYDGEVGYGDQSTAYWREGIYRKSAPETIAINYKDLSISGSAGGISNLTPSPVPTPAGTISGTSGNDVLNGTLGKDAINGFARNDKINGGAGNDVLSGGFGSDIFVFNTTLNASTNVDKITDFNPMYDTLYLENAVMGQVGSWGNLANGKFRIGSKALDSDDRIIYNTTTGALSYDSDGSGYRAQIKFATLSPNLKLTAADFYIL